MNESLSREIQRFQHARMSPAAIRRALGLRPVSSDPVKEEVEQPAEPPRRFPPTIDVIVRAVAAEAKLDIAELVPPKGKRRGANTRETIRPRQVLFLVLRQCTEATLEQIGACCCCHQSTVRCAAERAGFLIRRDPETADLYRRVCERLDGGGS